MNDPNEGIETFHQNLYKHFVLVNIEMNDPNEGIETFHLHSFL